MSIYSVQSCISKKITIELSARVILQVFTSQLPIDIPENNNAGYAEAQKVKMSSAKAKKGGKAVVKWKKNKAADGYLLYYKAKGVKAKKVRAKK